MDHLRASGSPSSASTARRRPSPSSRTGPSRRCSCPAAATRTSRCRSGPTSGAPLDLADSLAAATFEASSFGNCLELDGPALLVRRPVALARSCSRPASRCRPLLADERRSPPTRTTVGFEAACCSVPEPERPIRTPDAEEQHGECHADRCHARRDGRTAAGRAGGGGGAAVVAARGRPAPCLHERQPRAVPPRTALQAVALVVGERRVTARAVGLCPWCSTRCAFQRSSGAACRSMRGAARIADEEDLERRGLVGLDLLEDRPAGRHDRVSAARDAEDRQPALEQLGMVDDLAQRGYPGHRVVQQVRRP